MKWETIAFAALAGCASAVTQGVTQNIAPQGAAPAGCSPNYPGTFQISVSKTGSKAKRENGGALLITLNNGVLKDAQSRTGYIASNYQFQFDGPAQAGAIYTAGFSVCQNNLLALGPSTTFYQCGSGNFYNLYDRDWAPQCEPVTISIIPSGGSSSSSSQSGSAFGTTAVSQITDGQIQAPTGTDKPAPPPVTQIPDGQIQAPPSTNKPAPPPVVSQIPDGQIQAPTGTNKPAPPPQSSSTSSAKPAPPPVTQIPDGQIQAPPSTNKPAPPPPVVSQIPDGQVQAAPNPARQVSQIYDGQIQAPESSGRVVSQIPDGQIQVPPTNQPPPPPPTTKPPPPPPTVAPPPPPGQNTTVTTGKPSPLPPPPGPTYTYTSQKPIPTPPTPGPSPPPVLPPNSGIQVGPNAAMALIFGAIGALFFL